MEVLRNVIFFQSLIIGVIHCHVVDDYNHYQHMSYGERGYMDHDHSAEMYNHHPHSGSHEDYFYQPQVVLQPVQPHYHPPSYPNLHPYHGHGHGYGPPIMGSLYQPRPIELPEPDVAPYDGRNFPQHLFYPMGNVNAESTETPMKQMMEPLKKGMENMNEMGKKMSEMTTKPPEDLGKHLNSMEIAARKGAPKMPFAPPSEMTPEKEDEEKKDESESDESDKKPSDKKKSEEEVGEPVTGPMKKMEEAGSSFVAKMPKPPNPMKMMGGLTAMDGRVKDETTEALDDDLALFPRPERMEYGSPDFVDVRQRPESDFFDYYYDNFY